MDASVPESANPELSIVMPCLDEAETLATCIRKAKSYLQRSGVIGEIIIADNGSTDGSQAIAKDNGADVVNVEVRGYGAALIAGISSARGRYVIMADADDSYNFEQLDPFVEKLREGYDLVMGNRFKGGIAEGAMPPLHRYLGNPVLTGIGRLFFGSPSQDFHCGLRGFTREMFDKLNLRTTGMEFASEMVVKATLHKMRIAEVPTTLSPDGRSRAPHLRSWHDGWRHLRFLLLYSPRWLFLFPGMALLLVGAILMLAIIPGPLKIAGVVLDVHTLMIASAAMILGVQTISFAWLAKQFGTNTKLLPPTEFFERVRTFVSLEKSVFVGGVLMAIGIAGIGVAVTRWGSLGFGDLDYANMMRVVIPSITSLAIGFQILLTGFLSSMFDLNMR